MLASMSSVALSSLNRAALSAKEGYWWINGIALALSFVIARMSISAYWDAGDPNKALICVICQAMAIALAILARRALTGQMTLPGLAAGAGAAVCSWWASHGLALAWGDDANIYMVFVLTALEPAIFLLAEHVREGRDVLRHAHAKDEEETAAELARIREKDSARWGPRLAASGGIALGASPALASAGELAPNPAYSAEQAAIVSTNTGYATAHEHALALKRADPRLTQEQIGATVGAPRSTVGKWIRDAAA